jgi:hypothetical protein
VNFARGLCIVAAIAFGAPLAREAMTQSPRVAAPAKKPIEPVLLDRVAILGASVSHGFGNQTPLPAVFRHVLRTKDPKRAPVSAIFDHTEGNMYVDPQGFTERAIDACLEERVTLVVGVDVLFWFGYGVALGGKDELERRTKRLASGFALLERITCPLVIGDLPDVRKSTSKLLAPLSIPSVEVLAALNEQIRAWAKPRANVTIVPLASWVTTLHAGTWSVPPPTGSKAKPELLPMVAALQPDGLHPTDLGTHALAHELIAAIRERHGRDAAALVFDGYEEARTRKLWPLPAPASKR